MTSDTNPIRSTPIWSYDGISTEDHFVEQKWETLEGGLHYLLDKLQDRKDLIDKEFGSYEKYIYCGSFQESLEGTVVFSPELFRKLFVFNYRIVMQHYFCEGDES